MLKPQGLEDQVLRLALTGKLLLLLCTSPSVLVEYARVVPAPKFKLKPDQIVTALEQLEKASSLFHPSQTLKISDDEADNRFYECADAAHAAFLVTGNLKHFKKDHKTTRIVTARQLLDLLSSKQV